MAGGVLFGPAAWDPVAITAQIAAIQCLYYLSLGVLYSMIVRPYVPSLTLYHFFDWRWLSFSSFQGWMVSLATFTNALIAAVYLRLIVQRAKKCLDFAGTILFIHLVAVTCFSGFPRHIAWWALHGTNLAATALLGEWLCMQKEMQEIPLTTLRRNGAAAAATKQPSSGRASSSGGGGGSIGSGRAVSVNILELSGVRTQNNALVNHADWAPMSPTPT